MKKSKHIGYRPTWAEIDLANLGHNFRQIKKLLSKDCLVMATVKADAYGHGLIPVANKLTSCGVDYLGVASIDEGIKLRRAGVRSKILVIGYTLTENILSSRLKDVCFTLSDFQQLAEISKKLKSKKVFHLKIDTGMHRQGIKLEEVLKSVEIIKSNQYLQMEGICSHLADAGNPDSTFTLDQILKWNSTVRQFKQHFPKLLFFHLAASSGIRYSEKIVSNVARLGLGLYGISQINENLLNLKPALELKSTVSGIKNLSKGDQVGYGLTFTAKQNMKIVSVPVGYFEGVDLRLSNCGSFKIEGKFCPIVGRISMNISMVDVSSVSDIQINSPVVVISSQPEDVNSIENIAKLCRTIPYEILVHIPAHLRRTII